MVWTTQKFTLYSSRPFQRDSDSVISIKKCRTVQTHNTGHSFDVPKEDSKDVQPSCCFVFVFCSTCVPLSRQSNMLSFGILNKLWWSLPSYQQKEQKLHKKSHVSPQNVALYLGLKSKQQSWTYFLLKYRPASSIEPTWNAVVAAFTLSSVHFF